MSCNEKLGLAGQILHTYLDEHGVTVAAVLMGAVPTLGSGIQVNGTKQPSHCAVFIQPCAETKAAEPSHVGASCHSTHG